MNYGFEQQNQGPDFKRLLLAVFLTSGLLFGYNYFFAPKSVAISNNPANVNTQKLAPNEFKPPVVKENENIPLKEHKIVENVAANMADHSRAAVRGGYEANLINQGGQIKSFALTGYSHPTDLASLQKDGNYLFALESRNSELTLSSNTKYNENVINKNAILYSHVSHENIKVSHKYEFVEDKFKVKQSIQIFNNGSNTKKVELNISMVGGHQLEKKLFGFLGGADEGVGAFCSINSKRNYNTHKDLQKEAKSFVGEIDYLGFDKRYFLAALIPQQKEVTESCRASYWEDNSVSPKIEGIKIQLMLKPIMLAAGETKEINFESFLGPKQLELLSSEGHHLDENIDFGFMAVISRPLQWLLLEMYSWLGNFGLAIILLTLLIKLITFPLTQKSFISMQQSKKIAPELKALQDKYGHDRTLLSQKQMELYKEKGINPLAGCLPMLIQMPIWIALYQMLWNSVELYEQPFYLWISDLTRPDQYFVMPLVMGASMFVQQAFQPTPQDQPQMKYIMWFMPLFLTVIMLNMPSGLNLYILTNNVLTIIQQLYINKRYSEK